MRLLDQRQKSLIGHDFATVNNYHHTLTITRVAVQLSIHMYLCTFQYMYLCTYQYLYLCTYQYLYFPLLWKLTFRSHSVFPSERRPCNITLLYLIQHMQSSFYRNIIILILITIWEEALYYLTLLGVHNCLRKNLVWEEKNR